MTEPPKRHRGRPTKAEAAAYAKYLKENPPKKKKRGRPKKRNAYYSEETRRQYSERWKKWRITNPEIERKFIEGTRASNERRFKAMREAKKKRQWIIDENIQKVYRQVQKAEEERWHAYATEALEKFGISPLKGMGVEYCQQLINHFAPERMSEFKEREKEYDIGL